MAQEPFNLILIPFSISVFIRGYVDLGFAAGTVAGTGWPGWDWLTRSSFSNPGESSDDFGIALFAAIEPGAFSITNRSRYPDMEPFPPNQKMVARPRP